MAGLDWARRRAPELILAAVAMTTFLADLGSPDLWGKREQRQAAEDLDTVDHGHWLVAQIQGRQRLEKPPLPRWTVAGLILLTGRSDEWIVRLPGALSALGMVGLTYALGRRLHGRAVGVAAGLALTSTGFFISEMRQAGNDGPLALFTTLAIYAAWRRLHGDAGEVPATAEPVVGPRRWSLLLYLALGLGFLTKGPIILLLVAIALLPFLAMAGRFRPGVAALLDPIGILLFLAIALSWPVAVLLNDWDATKVWYLEMAQKTASAGVKHLRTREYLPLSWPSMTAPWLVLGVTGAVLPFLGRGKAYRPAIWLPFFWAMGNLAMFCLWKVAKPNYFLPCLPGVALLVGLEWVRLCQIAREQASGLTWSRLTLQGHWVALFLVGVIGPVVVYKVKPEWTAGFSVLGGLLAVGSVGAALAWRRGADALALAPIVASIALGTWVGYAWIVPTENGLRSHRELAATLDEILPDDARTIYFFSDLDEGLWFYLRDRDLLPVPGSQAIYNKAVELHDKFLNGTYKATEQERIEEEKMVLLDWLRSDKRTDRFLMIRTKIYDRLEADLQGIAEPIYREKDLARNELVLLQIAPPEVVATIAPATEIR